MLISFIIVNYNSGTLLEECISSIVDVVTFPFEIVVLDNQSTDGSYLFIEELNDKRIVLIKSEHNLGFAKGNNIAAVHAKGDILHFINPDAILNKSIEPDYKRIIENNQDKKRVFVNRISDELGKITHSRYLIPTIKNIFKYIFGQNPDYWYLGASIIIYRDFFEQINGWPEDYFMYAEDMDIFYIIYNYGGSVERLNSTVQHIGKGTTKNVWSEFERLVRVESSTRLFYKKYKRMWEYYLIVLIFFFYKLFKGYRPILYMKTVFYANRKANKPHGN
ncbi:glycosyltransferase family 2 protein [Chitinophaga japonensis]|uniref:GT2 family glycosyltransferase n=1 Tax=Chitinophaga japonensis TaxID=104662 RepID=A0A562TFL5_CHIJA|nr:glycosyltransferase family 2 protein [Chitinophaga japonensis]TWI92058.1 GT2 family glycosyltransferase [Chitinophaga japonensis]